MARRKTPAAIAASQSPVQGMRDRLFELAGFDPLEQAALTRRVIAKYAELLDATRQSRLVVNDGLHTSKIESFTDADSAIQARAASELVALMGLEPSKSTTGGSGEHKVQVQIAFVQRPEHTRAPKLVAKATIIDASPQK